MRFGVLCRLGATALALALVAAGCGGDDTTATTSGGPADSGTSASETVILHPNAEPLPGESACEVVITTRIPVASAVHVPVCTPVEYATNPPSGGDHWPKWAAYKSYAAPVPRPLYVHNLEHGGVVLAHRCAGECPEVTALLDEVMSGAADDPICLQVPGGPRARLVLTPDSDLATPIAASAWGATYTATCLDKTSLADFVASAYAHGPEDTCAQGIDPADPITGLPDCDAPAP